jgi:hypothetical protein
LQREYAFDVFDLINDYADYVSRKNEENNANYTADGIPIENVEATEDDWF